MWGYGDLSLGGRRTRDDGGAGGTYMRVGSGLAREAQGQGTIAQVAGLKKPSLERGTAGQRLRSIRDERFCVYQM